jgi:hypothetical protein
MRGHQQLATALHRRAGPATRKRKRAAAASFCRWAVRHDLLDSSPMDRIDAVEVYPARSGHGPQPGPGQPLPSHPDAHCPSTGEVAYSTVASSQAPVTD